MRHFGSATPFVVCLSFAQLIALPLSAQSAPEASYIHDGQVVLLERLLDEFVAGTHAGSQLPTEGDAVGRDGRPSPQTRRLGRGVYSVRVGSGSDSTSSGEEQLVTAQTYGSPTPRTSVSTKAQPPVRVTRAEQDELLRLYRDLPEVAWAYPVYRHVETGTRLYPLPRLVVRLGASADRAAVLESLPPSVRLQRTSRTGNLYVLELTNPAQDDPLSLSKALLNEAWIEAAEPDFVQEWRHFDTPNDTLFPNQWHLDNDGSLGSPPGVAGADARLDAAWDRETGDGSIVIAVIDDGVQTTHPDLASRIFTNPGETPGNSIDDDSNGYIDDVNGWDFVEDDNDPNPNPSNPSHGTSVAGVAAAAGDNALGVTGSCRNCKILPVRVADASFVSNSELGDAISYAGSLADVLNNSWGGGAQNLAIDDGIEDATTNGRGGLGAPTLFATGNSATGYFTLSLNSIPAGTYIFEWRYSKDGSGSAGLDAAWIDNVIFPGGEVEDFEDGARGTCSGLPAGWSSSAPAWTRTGDQTRANSNRGGHCAIGSGAIGDNGSTSVSVTKTVGAGTLFYDGFVNSAPIGGVGPFTVSCFDKLELYVTPVPGTITGPYFISCGTFSNQFNPLQDGVISYPASNADSIAVGGATNFDQRASFSQWGPELDFIAHTNGGSVGVTTTDMIGAIGYDTSDYTGAFGGTSSATPLAAGIVGLMLSADPSLTADQVRSDLRSATRQIGPVAYTRGSNDQYGEGVLSAEKLALEVPLFRDGFESGSTSAWN